MTADWTPCALGEIATVNPKCPLKAGTDAPFIAMADVRPDLGGVARWSRRQVTSGGARFRAGDVLVARITPCLENGKVARVPASLGEETGHGSTEFFVVRGTPGVSDTGFLHYLLSSRRFFAYAVPKMTGTSGRQRLPLDQLTGMQLLLPPTEEQVRMAGLLAGMDRVVDKYRETADTAMQLLDALWVQAAGTAESTRRVGDVASLDKGVSYKGEFLGRGRPLINLANFGPTARFDRSATKPYDGQVKPRHKVEPGEIVMANTDLTQRREVLARPALVPMDLRDAAFSHHTFAVRCPPDEREWIYATMRSERFHSHAVSYATGTTVAGLPRDAVLDYALPWPGDADRKQFSQRAQELLLVADQATRAAEVVIRSRVAVANVVLYGSASVAAA